MCLITNRFENRLYLVLSAVIGSKDLQHIKVGVRVSIVSPEDKRVPFYCLNSCPLVQLLRTHSASDVSRELSCRMP